MTGMPHAFERYNLFANFVAGGLQLFRGLSGLNRRRHAEPGRSFHLQWHWQPAFYLNGIREAGVNGFPRGNVQNDYNTWEPRVGFAYDFRGDGKTVITRRLWHVL